MQTKNGFALMDLDEFDGWLNSQRVSRSINRVQLHHTWSPAYRHFTGSNHFSLQAGMRSSHKLRGFSDIAQHFTIFPDGTIMTGRSLNIAPAGIKGANTGAICIEVLGNFDVGGDTMTESQEMAIIGTSKTLLERFNLNPNSITYHCWWTASGKSLGDYVPGKSTKTCPGTAFFGGNTRAAFERNLLPYLRGDIDMITEDRVRQIINEVLAGADTPSSWAKKEWEDAQGAGITDGSKPTGYLTREQGAAMIMRAIKED